MLRKMTTCAIIIIFFFRKLGRLELSILVKQR
ncbi:hypothetical protein NC652_029409 [Populus alba x Populus x berolinensis]|nr:hypothetical protein NC652_029409 [Populus alba x Populus x berolinensis]